MASGSVGCVVAAASVPARRSRLLKTTPIPPQLGDSGVGVVGFEPAQYLGDERVADRAGQQGGELVEALAAALRNQMVREGGTDLQKNEFTAVFDMEGGRSVRQADQEVTRAGEDSAHTESQIYLCIRTSAAYQTDLHKTSGRTAVIVGGVEDRRRQPVSSVRNLRVVNGAHERCLPRHRAHFTRRGSCNCET